MGQSRGGRVCAPRGGRPGCACACGGGRAAALSLLLLCAAVGGALGEGPVELGVGPVELEASMHSALLTDIWAAASIATAAPPTAGIPDSSAVVGQVFQMKIPDCRSVSVCEAGRATLPAWLHWDAERCLLLGVPLEGDRGPNHFTLSRTEQSRDVSADPAQPTSDPGPPERFTVTVSLEQPVEPEPVLPVAPQPGPGPPVATASTCGGEQSVTTLTVILDADLTKMTSRERVALVAHMSRFSSAGPELMRLRPVVNNRLFDMSAFMAGPGNAKHVVETGALLSWKLGCALDAATVPDLGGVRTPAQDGSMSARLGYPVVGWHIVNAKPPAAARRPRRHLHNTPTPVPSLLPPTAHPEPMGRVVPTPTSPAIAPATDSSPLPARGPLPLPAKPTIRLREQTAHTPTPGPPLPTRVPGTTSMLPIQPSVTRPGFVEATASPTAAATRRPKTAPTKKGRRPKTTAASREPGTSTAKTPRRTTPPPPRPPGDPGNEKPRLKNPMDEVTAWVGTYFEVKVPADTFFDVEDGPTRRLRLSLCGGGDEPLGATSWIQLNGSSGSLYGLPDARHAGTHRYSLRATDSGGLSAADAVQVRVSDWPAGGEPPVVFTARFDGDPEALNADVHRRITLSRRLARALGDGADCGAVALRGISRGSIVVEWTNRTLPASPCPQALIRALGRRLADTEGRPTAAFHRAMEPDFWPINVSVHGLNECRGVAFVPLVPPDSAPPPPAAPPPAPPAPSATSRPPAGATPAQGAGRRRGDDVYLHTVIPAVVVAALLLAAGVVAMLCYRRKRRGKLATEEQATFIKKGVPIIFADELDDGKAPPSASMPLILREEKPPLPPPLYPARACEGSLLEEYLSLVDDDPYAPPYQPPPPFTIPIEGKGSRPKNMSAYRCPPPYVPP